MSKCKYYLEKEVVSYDGGITWNETGVTRKGNLYEESSEDCTDPSVQYRWINMDVATDYICDGTNKYYKQKKQVSYDGLIWEDATPAEYQRGSIYEVNSPDCQPTKFQATYTGGQTYEKKCDGNTTLTTGDTKPEGYEYTAMAEAIIGDCITNIDNAAFRNCSGLASVTIPNSVTIIGHYAFDSCSSLTGITIPNSVTSIGEFIFDYCSNITTAIIGNGVTRISGYAFRGCSSLTGITIPNSTTSIGIGAFNYCSSLASVTIPNSVTSIGQEAFYRCGSLTNITIPNSVTSIGNSVFSWCSSLTSIDIPNSVTSIGNYVFNWCGSLTSCTIGSGVTSIGDGVFNGCGSLTSVTVNATTPPTLGSNAFDNTNDCPIYVPCQSLNSYKTASGWSSYASRIQAIP